ncbi:MAG: carboxypeptidase regulatory-like domain-containing protein [Gammaproteobacteria bacterium]|nr:carboxypeptidase regulatory-like domain-containing protein [Gammaproteobacteria bacterium]
MNLVSLLKRIVLPCLVAFVTMLSNSLGADQLANGFLFGVTLDEGEPIAGTKVTVEHLDTGLTRTVIASDTGTYRITQLPPGNYDVLASTADLKFLLKTVRIVIGEGTRADLDMSESNLGRNRANASSMEEVLVTGSRDSDLQGSFGEINTAFNAEEIDQLPIARDVNAVINMAPGAVLGDSQFSSRRNPLGPFRTTDTGLVSIHGSSIAENVYYVDGMNVSNLANGLGASVLPFEFYDQVQMVTGGLRAQFGRTTGGMVNAVTKGGTNEWKMRIGYFTEPVGLQGTSPDIEDRRANSRYSSSSSLDEATSHEGFFSVAGPLIHDKLYIYGIYEGQREERRDFQAGYSEYGTLIVTDSNDPFLGAKLDWDVHEDHRVSMTSFSDETRTKRSNFRWHETTNTVGERYRFLDLDRGGDNVILRYVGSLTDQLAVSVVAGTNSYEYNNSHPADEICPAAYDNRDDRRYSEIGCWVNRTTSSRDDLRRATRVDAEYVVNDNHILTFGFDRENNTTNNHFGYSGPDNRLYFYFNVEPGELLRNRTPVPNGITEIVQLSEFHGGGKFEDRSASFYIEDEWLVNDRLNIRIGLRHERFELSTSAGDPLVRIDDQWAPRIAAAFELGEHGSLVASLSHYHMPLPNAVSQGIGTSYLFQRSFYTLASDIKDDGSVDFGMQLGPTMVYKDGSPPQASKIVDPNLKSMYQQEFTIGYSRDFPNDFLAGVDYTNRTLKETIEDIALLPFLGGRGGGWNMNYYLTNPGHDVTVIHDWDGDGVAERLEFSAEELRFPKPKRQYHALEMFVDKKLSRKLYLRGSYTWSHSYGNHEGLARTDLDRGGHWTGVSAQWDFLGLTDGAEGNLPNDRRHSVKLFGVWRARENLQASFAWSLSDGRPRNAFAYHPTDFWAGLYGPISFFNESQPSPRGALGRTDSIHRIDAGLRYTQNIGRSKLTVKLDVFNVFNESAVLDYNDTSQIYGRRPNPNFGLPSWHQRPRHVRIGLILDLL